MSDQFPPAPIASGVPKNAPFAIRLVAALGFVYAVAVVGAAAYVLVLLRGGVGGLAAAATDRFVLRGAVMLVLALLMAAVAFVAGARRLLRGGRGALMLALPLAVLVVVGTVGGIADAMGGVDGSSLLVGLGIIAAAGVPLPLLNTREARDWTRG